MSQPSTFTTPITVAPQDIDQMAQEGGRRQIIGPAFEKGGYYHIFGTELSNQHLWRRNP